MIWSSAANCILGSFTSAQIYWFHRQFFTAQRVLEARIRLLRADIHHEEAPEILGNLIQDRRRRHEEVSEWQILAQSACAFDVTLNTLPQEGSTVVLRSKRDLWCWIWAITDYSAMLASGALYSADAAEPILAWLRKLNDSLSDAASGWLLDDTTGYSIA